MGDDICREKTKAELVAKFFVWKNKVAPKETGLDKLKLQKLLYYAQAWNLVFNKKILFDEEIEAWVHGPVVPSIYYLFKDFNFFAPQTIDEKCFDSFSNDEKRILDEVWEVYGKYDGSYLENLTHNELPWQEARKGIEELQPSKKVILVETMQSFYGQRLKEVNQGVAG